MPVSIANSSVGRRDLTKTFFWGCELSQEKPEDSFIFPEVNDEEDDECLSHAFVLKQAVLGTKAEEGESNVVEIETKNFEEKVVTQPIVHLVKGTQNMCSLDLDFVQGGTVTLRLKEGAGPVYISAVHQTDLPEDLMDEDFNPFTVSPNTDTSLDEIPSKSSRGTKRKSRIDLSKKKVKKARSEEDDIDEDEDEDEVGDDEVGDDEVGDDEVDDEESVEEDPEMSEEVSEDEDEDEEEEEEEEEDEEEEDLLRKSKNRVVKGKAKTKVKVAKQDIQVKATPAGRSVKKLSTSSVKKSASKSKAK